jgi:hypothetical protein
MANLSSFSDEFEGSALNESLWNIHPTRSDVSVSGGILTLGGINGGNISTIEEFDASTEGFEILITTFQSDFYAIIADDGLGQAGFLISEFDELVIFYFDDGDSIYEEDFLPYDSGTWSEGYLKFYIDDSSTMHWETSSDGVSWTEVFSYEDTGSSFNYSNVVIELQAFGAPGNEYDIDYVRGVNSEGAYPATSNSILSLPSAGSMFPIAST